MDLPAIHQDNVLSPLKTTPIDCLVFYQESNKLVIIPLPTVEQHTTDVIDVVNGPRPGDKPTTATGTAMSAAVTATATETVTATATVEATAAIATATATAVTAISPQQFKTLTVLFTLPVETRLVLRLEAHKFITHNSLTEEEVAATGTAAFTRGTTPSAAAVVSDAAAAAAAAAVVAAAVPINSTRSTSTPRSAVRNPHLQPSISSIPNIVDFDNGTYDEFMEDIAANTTN